MLLYFIDVWPSIKCYFIVLKDQNIKTLSQFFPQHRKCDQHGSYIVRGNSVIINLSCSPDPISTLN